MVQVRQDELPKTIVLASSGQLMGVNALVNESSDCSQEPLVISNFDWIIRKGSSRIAYKDQPNNWSVSGGYGTGNFSSEGMYLPIADEYECHAHLGAISYVVDIPALATIGTYNFTDWSSTNAFDLGTLANIAFRITGDLTGTVSVSAVENLEACVDLKADASTGQKVISAEINWGDGNATTVSPSPNTQHYFGGNICHTYTTADTYTITATYQDDDSHTIHPDTEVTVDCINSASMAIQSTGSSNGKNPANGVYTHCYAATVSHSTAAGESYSYDWTFPDNTTVNNGGGSSDQTASFCIATTDINWQSNFGVVLCKITKTVPSPPCDVTVSSQLAGPGGTPPPAGPLPGDDPPKPGQPPC